MKTIAVSCRKGGSGKTTSTQNIAASIVMQKPKASVLMVDLDPQASLTIMSGFEPGDKRFSGMGTRSMFNSDSDITDCCFGIETMGKDFVERLYLMPADYALSIDEMHLARERNGVHILKNRLKTLENEFEYVLLDCPPQLEMLTLSAWWAANEVIIPTRPDYISYRAWASTKEAIGQYIERHNPNLTYRGTIVTMYEKVNKEQRQTLDQISDATDVLGIVKKSADVTRDTFTGIPMVMAYPRSEPAESYREIAHKLI